MRTCSFFELDGRERFVWQLRSRPLLGGATWDDMRADIAAWNECDPDDVETREVFWGGEYGDAERTEIVTVAGNLVGSFDRPLDAVGIAAAENVIQKTEGKA